MTIENKLAYLEGTKAVIKSAIEDKGVAVPEETTFREYADKISQISGGGGGGEVPSVDIANLVVWESAFSNGSAQFNMSYELANEGDTVFTVLWYYEQSSSPTEVTPSGVLELISRVEGFTSSGIYVVLELYKHVKTNTDPEVNITIPGGSGRRQLGYFCVPEVDGYSVQAEVVSTEDADNPTDNIILLPTQQNDRPNKVTRIVSLGYSIAFTASGSGSGTAAPLRYVSAPPVGWFPVLNMYNDQGGTSNQVRTYTIGTILEPNSTAQHLQIPLTPALGNNTIKAISYDIYYSPLPSP